MCRFATAFVLGVGMLVTFPIQAGEFNKKLSVGDAAPAWSDLPGVDDQTHSLADLENKDVVVVVFTCNHCPVAVAYEDRIIEFTKNCSDKVAVVAICVNDYDADKLPEMKERAKNKGFNFTYLYDESQKSGRAFGATVTPEFFVLNKERKVVYMGAMDDNMNKPTVSYLEQAVSAILKGEQPPKAETRARGCSVKYSKESK
jgi:peroxiredoxin